MKVFFAPGCGIRGGERRTEVFMRVIAGKARRILLDTPEGLATRPTTDRIKETLFNMINRELPDAVFLDLFAGSGAIGIEALSRGCRRAVFVEQDKKAVFCIEANLKRTGLSADAEVFKADVAGALSRLAAKGEAFDIIFMDPPYRMGFAREVLAQLAGSAVCGEKTLVVFEEALETDISFVEECGFRTVKEKCYKTNKHVFVRKNVPAGECGGNEEI